MAAGRGAEPARDGAAGRGPRERRGGRAAGGRARGGDVGGARGPRRARTRQARVGDGAEPGRNPTKARRRGTMKTTLVLGLNGFRLGGRLFGREGYAGGAWLNGETRAEGFSLDGRVEHDGKAHNFKMNVQVDEWLRRAARWWSPGLTDL